MIDNATVAPFYNRPVKRYNRHRACYIGEVVVDIGLRPNDPLLCIIERVKPHSKTKTYPDGEGADQADCAPTIDSLCIFVCLTITCLNNTCVNSIIR